MNVEIEFLKDWLGHDAGSRKILGSDIALSLVEQGAVKILREIPELVVETEPVKKAGRKSSKRV